MARSTFRCAVLPVAALSFALLAGTPASANPITFVGSSGSLAASATFDVSGSSLIVTLTNTSSADVLVPTDVLTGVFFNLGGNPTLAKTSATIGGGSTVLFGGTDAGGVVGGEWAYKTGVAGPGGAGQGISSSGLGLFGPGDRFPGTNLQGPNDPDGLQYGITSAGDNSGTGNTPVTGTNALIQNQVVFVLGGLPAGFDPSRDVSSVTFQYGTALTDPQVPGTPNVPEPMSLLLLGMGVLAVGTHRKTRKA